MPREQLLGLVADVDRLVNAGATAACGNENLQRRSRTLRELGKRVAVLNAVADAVDKLTQAPAAQVGASFLHLVTMMRQVRASLAATEIAGDLQPSSASGPWRTPLSVRELNPLCEALSHSGSGREQLLRDSLERNALGDMRLLPVMLDALGDNYAPIAELVAQQALPSLGKAALPELLASLSMEGRAADVRRLMAICAIDKQAGTELCRRALKEGNTALRAKALQLLADLLPAEEAEELALSFIKDKSKEVRLAALTALHVGRSDQALDVLVEELCRPNSEGRNGALSSLVTLCHSGTTTRLLTELEAKLAVALAPAPKKVKSKAVPTTEEKQQAEATRADAIVTACNLMHVLGVRKDGDLAAAARALLPIAQGDQLDLKEAALEALGPAARPFLPDMIDRIRTGDSRHWRLTHLFVKVDPEGTDVIPAMIDLLRERKSPAHNAALQILTHYGPKAKAAVPTLVELQERNDTVLRHWIDSALRAIDR